MLQNQIIKNLFSRSNVQIAPTFIPKLLSSHAKLPSVEVPETPLNTGESLKAVLDTQNVRTNTQTNLDILNQTLEDSNQKKLFFSGYTASTFKLSTRQTVIGSCIAFPQSVLSWNVNNASEIDEHSLALFGVLEPRIDLLIVGKGPKDVRVDMAKLLMAGKSLGIQLEIMNTIDALATFNFLNSEHRLVAAALLPVRDPFLFDEDRKRVLALRKHRWDMFEEKDMHIEFQMSELSHLFETQEKIEANKPKITPQVAEKMQTRDAEYQLFGRSYEEAKRKEADVWGVGGEESAVDPQKLIDAERRSPFEHRLEEAKEAQAERQRRITDGDMASSMSRLESGDLQEKQQQEQQKSTQTPALNEQQESETPPKSPLDRTR